MSVLALGMYGICLSLVLYLFLYLSLFLSGSGASFCFFRVVMMMVSVVGVVVFPSLSLLCFSSSLSCFIPYLGMGSAPGARRGLSQRSSHLQCVVVGSSVR